MIVNRHHRPFVSTPATPDLGHIYPLKASFDLVLFQGDEQTKTYRLSYYIKQAAEFLVKRAPLFYLTMRDKAELMNCANDVLSTLEAEKMAILGGEDAVNPEMEIAIEFLQRMWGISHTEAFEVLYAGSHERILSKRITNERRSEYGLY